MERLTKFFAICLLATLPILSSAEVTIRFPTVKNDKSLCYEDIDLVFEASSEFTNNSLYCANSLVVNSPEVTRGILCWKTHVEINGDRQTSDDVEGDGPWYGHDNCNQLCAQYCK